MKTRGYAVEITNLSPNATEKDVRDFLTFCGAIQHVEFVRTGDSECVAYVTFKNPHAVETAVFSRSERHEAAPSAGKAVYSAQHCKSKWPPKDLYSEKMQWYHISGTTRSAVSVTQRTAASAANAVVSSSYFSKGALWLSGALNRASQVAGDLGNRGVGKDSQ
ncbi:hypothetical protein SASPL_156791 [Salvia splendens]|uniref:RRM domain-containing protein n=1 Tax=Salvia splendens TaxID=180675 RepID=A0A8X8YVE2_SALSN|nr:hypothetical protein SASPL_156791 [Salvia splendens]